MKNNPVTIIIAIVILAVGFFISKVFSVQKDPQLEKYKKIVKHVSVVKVQNDTIRSFVPVTGKLIASGKLDIVPEVMGAVNFSEKPFKEGIRFTQGEVMLKIDDEEFRMNMLAQKSAFMNLITQILPDLKLDHPGSFNHWSEYLDNYVIEDDHGNPQKNRNEEKQTGKNEAEHGLKLKFPESSRG